MKRLPILLLFAFCGNAADWADRAEYDLVLSVRAEMLPQKRLALLDQWKAKYPKSGYQQARRELYFAAYQSLGDSERVLDTAAEILGAEPAHAQAAYWYTVLLPQAGTVAPERLALGEKTSRALLTGATEPVARRTLAWVQWQRGDFAAAETELRQCLATEPGKAETAAWLGTVLASQTKQPEKQPQALWYLARAASLKGDGALPDSQRKQMNGLVQRLYASYHGEAAGLDRLLAAASAAPDPPAGFTIESAAAMAIRKFDEILAQENPRLGEWVKMRRQLESEDGDRYFNDTLHNNPLTPLKGTLIRGVPENKPTELVVGVEDPATPEIVLKLPREWAKAPAPGTVIQFEGSIDSFVKQPFTLTLITEPAKITK